MPLPALADRAFPYAAVACRGNRALVRFGFFYGEPAFAGLAAQLPSKTARDLDALAPANPSRCVLADGRRVVLRQGDKGDSRGYGQCGGDQTELFSLWVGRKPVYRREVWHRKCGVPYDIKAIVVDGAHLEECRVPTASMTDPAGPPSCEDRSGRMAVADASPGHPGEMVLLRKARGMARFCRSLVRQAAPPAETSWPTYQRTGLQEIFSAEERERLQAVPAGTLMDLDNGGRPVRAVVSDRYAGGGDDLSVWSFLPADATDDEVWRLKVLLDGDDEDALRDMRAAGTVVYAGDQTAVGHMSGVHLIPFRRRGVTWMLAVSEWSWPPGEIVLRPTPRGDMMEVCAFAQTPPL